MRGKCRACGGQRTPEGYDPCVGFLAGAQHVCCGHNRDGDSPNRYVITVDGRRFNGLQAFQRWKQWASSPQGRTVIALDSHAGLFGWRHPNAGRNPCSSCGLPRYECRCSPQP